MPAATVSTSNAMEMPIPAAYLMKLSLFHFCPISSVFVIFIFHFMSLLSRMGLKVADEISLSPQMSILKKLLLVMLAMNLEDFFTYLALPLRSYNIFLARAHFIFCELESSHLLKDFFNNLSISICLFSSIWFNAVMPYLSSALISIRGFPLTSPWVHSTFTIQNYFWR